MYSLGIFGSCSQKIAFRLINAMTDSSVLSFLNTGKVRSPSSSCFACKISRSRGVSVTSSSSASAAGPASVLGSLRFVPAVVAELVAVAIPLVGGRKCVCPCFLCTQQRALS